MSDTQPTPDAQRDDDDFLSGEGTPTFAGFAYSDSTGHVRKTRADIAGRKPGATSPATAETTYGSGWGGWTHVTSFTLELQKVDSNFTAAPSQYSDMPETRPSHPGKSWYITSIEASAVLNEQTIQLNVTREWVEFQD